MNRAFVATVAAPSPQPQTAPATDDLDAYLIGTWAAIALMGKVMISKGVVSHRDLLQVIEDAEAATAQIDRRHVAFGAVRAFIDRLNEAQLDQQPERKDAPRRQ